MAAATVRRRVCEVVGRPGPLGARLLDGTVAEVARLSDAGPEVAPGDVVVAEPGPDGWRALRVLARAGSLKAELVRLAVDSGVEPTYPPEVLEETRALTADSGTADPALVDRRDLPWVTIDNDDSRDLDQALAIERDGDGFRVWYALADASWFVRPGTALHAEALARGSSYYLPGFAVPMLPPALSEGVVSLNPEVDRRAVVFDVELDGFGEVRSVRLERARIHSQRKLSYRRVQRAWDDPGGSGLGGESFAGSLELLRRVGALRIASAERRHAVSFQRREVEVVLDRGERTGFRVLARERLEVERANEQISLLVNVEGARFLESQLGGDRVQPIFRVHPAPSLEALSRLAVQVEALIRRHELDPDRWRWRRDADEPLAAYLERLPRRTPLARAIERQALLTNERSQFGSEPEPHFGVAAPVYARFSSPMREMVGIFTHKEAAEALGWAPSAPVADDLALRDVVVAAGNRAKELQRLLASEADRLVLDRLFAPELGRPVADRRVLHGTLLGLRPHRLYVALDDPPVEVKLDVAAWSRALGLELVVDPLGVELAAASGRPRFLLGDRLALQVSGRDPDSGRWDLVPVSG